MGETYYDATRVFFQIGDYLKDPSWHVTAHKAQQIYLDGYLVPNDGKVPGYWNFSHGLTESALRNDDTAAKNGVKLLAFKASFAPDESPISFTKLAESSREVAFTVMAHYNVERLGESHRRRTDELVKQSYSHLNQWFTSKFASYVRPFMVALTAEAIITDFERTKNPRAISELTIAADEMWDTMWLPKEQAFLYSDIDTSKPDPKVSGFNTGGTDAASDLNLIIASLYAFLHPTFDKSSQVN